VVGEREEEAIPEEPQFVDDLVRVLEQCESAGIQIDEVNLLKTSLKKLKVEVLTIEEKEIHRSLKSVLMIRGLRYIVL
jgi:DNA polymerase I-like protein with 3'-5' exonuclease and polymerase domains